MCMRWGMECVDLEVCLGDLNCALQEATQQIGMKFRNVIIVFYIQKNFKPLTYK